MEKLILDQLATLGHASRLSVFRMLMRRYPDAVPAGEIAGALELKASTLSVYLAALRRAGLLWQIREGTSLRYRVDMENAGALVAYLFEDCCRSRPAIRAPEPVSQPRGDPTVTQKTYDVLFICTGNSARSIFAETILRDAAADRFTVHSAGTRPYSELNPFALEVLEAKGHDVTGLRAKTISEFQAPGAPVMDFVFTVCDRAANEECPSWEGQPVSAHWGVPDPVKAEGTDAQKSLAFQEAYGALRNRILAFTALPIGSLDRISLQRAVDGIAADQEATGT